SDKDIPAEYERAFVGMTGVDCSLDERLEARARLRQDLPQRLTRKHKQSSSPGWCVQNLVGLYCDAPMLHIFPPCAGSSPTHGCLGYPLLTLIIGEPMPLDNSNQRVSRWWEDVV